MRRVGHHQRSFHSPQTVTRGKTSNPAEGWSWGGFYLVRGPHQKFFIFQCNKIIQPIRIMLYFYYNLITCIFPHIILQRRIKSVQPLDVGLCQFPKTVFVTKRQKCTKYECFFFFLVKEKKSCIQAKEVHLKVFWNMLAFLKWLYMLIQEEGKLQLSAWMHSVSLA